MKKLIILSLVLFLGIIVVQAQAFIHVKAVLQGAYNSASGEMDTDLTGLIPLTDPYSGTTTVGSIPADVVDWVLVQVRDAADNTSTVYEKACFLRKDGAILDTDGTLGVTLTGLDESDGYVVIKHRNHLGVMIESPIFFGINDTYCPNNNSTSTTNVGCDTSPTMASVYMESVATDVRTMTSNSYPNHDYKVRDGTLNPMTNTYMVDATPSVAASSTSVLRPNNRPARYFGIALNGVILAPAPATPFIFEHTNTGEYNWDWVFEPTLVQGQGSMASPKVALDCATAHEGPQGYHYHGNMFAYAETLLAGISDNTTVPTNPVQMGWASDGFPILYRYAPDGTGGLALLTPSYQLKKGLRPGDGVSEPCGNYSGRYTNDFEYVAGSGDLDECNGIARSVTLPTVEGNKTFSYFYVVTDAFPQIGRCLSGTPDGSFEN